MNGDGLVNNDDRALFTQMISAGGNAAIYLVYTWDAENRLIKVEPGATNPPTGSQKAEYKYDWQGRRIEKQVWSRTGRSQARSRPCADSWASG